jgi:hypothetical protein
VLLNAPTKIKNSERLIDGFAEIGAARRGFSLPDQTACLGLVVFFQREFGNGRPVLIHNGHLPIGKTEREQAVSPELFGNFPGALACRLDIREIKLAFGNSGRAV